MATSVFKDWINAKLSGNCDSSATLVEAEAVEVEFDFILDVTTEAERKKERVGAAEHGPTIEAAEGEAYHAGTPIDAVAADLARQPIVYMARSGRRSVPGWVFSETETIPCRGCGQTGQVECGSCRGKGTVGCKRCSSTGLVSCATCNGRGYVFETVHVRDENGNFRYAQKRRACFCANGRIRCPNCSGSTTVRCQPCHGSGRVVCEGCSGKGLIFERTTKTYFAVHRCSLGFESSDSRAGEFVSRRWDELVRHGCPRVTDTSLLAREANRAGWSVSGVVRVESQKLAAGATSVSVLGSVNEAEDPDSAVFDVSPFLGETLGVEDWKGGSGAGRKLLELSSKRIVREGLTAWNAEGGKEAQRRAAVESALARVYGPALSAKHRTSIAEVVGVGLKKLRAERLRVYWIRYSLLSAFFGMALVVGILLLNDAISKGVDIARSSVVWGALVAFGLWIVGGLRFGRRAVASLGKRLGLKVALAGEQGVWNVFGPILGFVALNVGTGLGLALALAIIAHTQWIDPRLRAETIRDPQARRFLPTMREIVLKSDTPLRGWPDAEARATANAAAGSTLGVVGAPVNGWTPVRFGELFGWVRLE